MEIEWRDIPGYEGLYQVSNYGEVKSLPTKKEKVLKQGLVSFYTKEIILKQGLDKYGYPQVILYKNKKPKTFKVHQLVCIVFLNHKPDGTQKIVVDHINNIKTDNRVINLQLITNRENTSKDKNNFTSRYIGVSWSKKLKKWLCHLGINGQSIHLGCSYDEQYLSNLYKKGLDNIHLYEGDNKKFRKLIKEL